MSRLLTISNLIKEVRKLKKEGKKIGLCYGGFDLLHPGHVKHLEEARKVCDVLVVGITKDKYLRKRKGDGRPIFNQELRAYQVSQIKSVNFVFINPGRNAISAIKKIKPHFCIKGEDYADPNRPKKNQPLEEEATAAVGARVIFTRTGEFAKIRTTKLIQQL